MNQDKLKGKANEVAGSVKSKVGDKLGNDEMRAEGEDQELKGKAQGIVGEAKDKLSDLKDKVS